MLSGRAMCRHLVSLGVAAQKVVRKQETGEYVADFFVPEMDDAILPAKTWAQRISEALPNAHIIRVHDTIAGWRPEQPVICATVTFRWLEQEAA